VLDLTRLDGAAVCVDAARRTARCAAGATFATLDSAAALHGLRLPPAPSSWRWATLGGMVATNAAGARSFRFGSIRPWVTGLTMVTPDGDRLACRRGESPDERHPAVARFVAEVEPLLRASDTLIRGRFPIVRKNSAGYALDRWLASGDLLDLVIGAEGTLGIVTEVELRLDVVPDARALLRIAVRDEAALAAALTHLGDSGASAIELLDHTFLRFAGVEGEAWAVLLVEFEGTPDAAAHWRDRWWRRMAPLAASVEAATDPGEIEHLWALRHVASSRLAALEDGRRSLQVIEDGCVPPEKFVEYVGAVRRIAARQDVTAVLFGHAGDGHVHVNLLPDVTRPGWERVVATVFDAVSEVQLALGGTPAGEHGAGRLRAGLLQRLYGAEVMELFRAVKAAFDPAGILNPGVVLGGAPPFVPFTRLKVGAERAPLPDDIADKLREIERTGAWDTDRFALAAPSAS
jgi:FAD/FMN-containing dehydrogenase